LGKTRSEAFCSVVSQRGFLKSKDENNPWDSNGIDNEEIKKAYDTTNHIFKTL